MANANSDLPGFIRDANGKYYRVKPGDRGNPSIKKIKLEINLQTATEVKPRKMTNIVNYLANKKIGLLEAEYAEKEYCRMMAQSKKEVQHESLNLTENFEQPNMIKSVEFMVGGKFSNIGLWSCKIQSSYKYVMMENKFHNLENQPDIFTKVSNFNIIDMCEVNNEIIAYISNDFKNFSSLHSFEKHSELETKMFVNETLYCCSDVGNEIQYVAGGENCIKIFSPDEMGDSFQVKGRVYTLSSASDKRLLAAGLHNGRIQFYSTNTNNMIDEIKDLEACIVESAFTENSSYAVFAGMPNKLFLVDLRTNRVVSSYIGHCQTLAKKHISIANNLLSITGGDNIIRIWHISGGLPIFEMEPVVKHENNIRGWLSTEGHKTYLNYFEADFKKVFQIL